MEHYVQKNYESPSVEVVDVNAAKVVCQSAGINSMTRDSQNNLDW